MVAGFSVSDEGMECQQQQLGLSGTLYKLEKYPAISNF
jgi:hypothetical protein